MPIMHFYKHGENGKLVAYHFNLGSSDKFIGVDVLPVDTHTVNYISLSETFDSTL